MKIPPFLMTITLFFWVWQTGITYWLAIAMAVMIEASRLISWRWELSPAHFRRISNLTLIIVIIAYWLVIFKSFGFVYALLQVLPILFFPLLIAQTYSTSDRVDLRTFFLFWNQRKAYRRLKSTILIDLNDFYLFICLLAASAGNTQNISFYLGMFLIFGIALAKKRAKHFSPLLWATLLVLAGILGIIGATGLHHLQTKVEQSTEEWLSDFFHPDADPLRTNTAIGDIGFLKQSDAIILRMKPDNPKILPQRLRESIYNHYQSSLWIAGNNEFQQLAPHPDNQTWQIAENSGNTAKITLTSAIPHHQGLLKLPNGTVEVQELPVSHLAKNQYGTVKIEGASPLITYHASFNPALSFDSPPNDIDLQIPVADKPAIEQIIQTLNLDQSSSSEKVRRIEDFFQQNFSYSLRFEGNDGKPKTLSAFLLQNHSGHCEYFATATTLLLRAAGIPARYVVGYSVHEFSPLENQYIVRSRHAHAWTLAYLQGNWQAIDTTPEDWTSIEDSARSQWGIFQDFVSFLQFKFTQAWNKLEKLSIVQYIWWLIPLVVLVRWRKFLRKPAKKEEFVRKNRTSAIAFSARTDSPIDLIEKALNQLGFQRHPSETFRNWIERIKPTFAHPNQLESLLEILTLHYRERFDPQGISPTQQQHLDQLIQAWLNEQNSLNSLPKN